MLGFTLLEVLIAVIIVSILSTLGFVQYGKLMERQYGRNAVAYLRAIRAAELDYYIRNKSFTSIEEELDLSAGIFDADQYFDTDLPIVIGIKSFKKSITRKNNAYSGYGESRITLAVTVSDVDLEAGIDTVWETTNPAYENLF